MQGRSCLSIDCRQNVSVAVFMQPKQWVQTNSCMFIWLTMTMSISMERTWVEGQQSRFRVQRVGVYNRNNACINGAHLGWRGTVKIWGSEGWEM